MYETLSGIYAWLAKAAGQNHAKLLEQLVFGSSCQLAAVLSVGTFSDSN
jgi:hypothetical protein